MSLIRLLPASAFIMAALSGCSYFHFTSNVAPDRFSEYFKASGVEQLTKEELVKRDDYEILGTVSGSSCQETERDAPPKERLARKALLEAAHDAGADAAVMDKCVEMRESAMCARSIVCYGEAVKLVKGSPAKAEDPEKADEAGAEDSGEKTDV